MTLRARQLSCTGRVWIFEPQHSWEAAERLMQAMSNRLWGALYKRLNRKHSKWAAQGTSDPRVYTQAYQDMDIVPNFLSWEYPEDIGFSFHMAKAQLWEGSWSW